jgi:surface antigen
MLSMFIIIYLLIPPYVAAQGIIPDEFIGQYDIDKTYQSASEYIDTPPVQRMPHPETNTHSKTIQPLQVLPRETFEQSPSDTIPTDTWGSLYGDLKINLIALLSFTSLVTLLQQINSRISSLRSLLTRLRTQSKEHSTGISDEPGSDTVVTLINTLPLSLAYGENSTYLSRFSTDPKSNVFPKEVMEVLSWDQRWNPAQYPQDYVQCTTYVAITYQLNGITLKGKIQGDARDWVHLTDTFTVHHSGTSAIPPQPLDTMVWAEGTMNHVGIVTEVRNNRITVANGNSTAEYHYYRYRTTATGKIEITSVNGEMAQSGWVPSHWLRPKPALKQTD